ncbi:MAG: hypothetical protein JWN71_2585 [Xanthobacteraceae bacterium]|nr:hypothetical protein [Xanthobacteraceae bacterium]
MKVRYCTLFDTRYTTRGLTMLSSLMPFLRDGDEIVVLAMDDGAARILGQSGYEALTVVRVDALQDRELLDVRETRARREFCWTCTPAFTAWMVNNTANGDIVVYLDADLMFFADPRILLDELSDGGNILIHEHRYSSDKAHFASTNGRFNVGFVAFRVGDESRACVTRWRAQTIERCELDPENGYCGDQGYLDEWPARYSGLRVMRNIGGGVAPWNVNQYQVRQNGAGPTVDGEPVVFFHYHALETIVEPHQGFVAVHPSAGYAFTHGTLKFLYRPYARRIRQADDDVAGMNEPNENDRIRHWLDIAIGRVLGRYVGTH